MSAERTLEDRYRRLLALYPAGHRAVHGEEMLGVLLTAAPPGQRRPGRAESAALIWGAARIWLRPGRSTARQQWQDGLAAVSVLLPLIVSAYWGIGQVYELFSQTHSKANFAAQAYSDLWDTGPWLVVAVLVLFRRRWIAAVVATGALIWTTYSTAAAPNLSFIGPPSMLYAVALGLEIAALLASPGPRRGREILSWRHYVLAGVVAVTVAGTWVTNWLWLGHQGLSDAINVAVVVAGLVMLAVSSPTGRRSMALLLIPAYYFVLGFLVMPSMTEIGIGSYESGWEGLPRITLTCAPLAAIAGVAALMVVRYIRRPHPAAPAGPQPPAIM